MKNTIKQIVLLLLALNLSMILVDGDILDLNFPTSKDNQRLLTNDPFHTEGIHSVTSDEIYYIDQSKDNQCCYNFKVKTRLVLNSAIDKTYYLSSIWQPPKFS
jgi:hypothetical protein